ncbi:ATP-dependent 6-phosphofructokinase [bioreactor metagenome]|uniref:ATP-dependent 6-phosphofructokinase n=1 Tax=bioreactor metagenome TaxID=1076179 RepID=A0A644WCL1_9ZZZZ|nr:carbohydrate kinase [Paludibacter sp.]
MTDLIIGIGEILWDVFPQGKVLGGAPANFAHHVSQLGLNGCAVSAIGNDELGKEILHVLGEKRLNTYIEKVNYPTGTVQVTLSGNGIPQYEICEDVAWDNIPFSDELEKMAKHTKTVCFGSLAQRSPVSHATINKFLDSVPTDAMKIFDINLRQHFYSKTLIEESLKRCNVLKINDDEVLIVSNVLGWNGITEAETAIRLMQDYKLDIVVLTKGTEGSYVFTPIETSFLPTPLVEVADTVGAGDSFTAGFVASLLKGKSIREAHRKAVEISAYVCTQHGAMPLLPDSLI